MAQARNATNVPTMRHQLRLYDPDVAPRTGQIWRINGYPARIVLWTREEWEKMANRPTDAQYFPCGVWGALRLE